MRARRREINIFNMSLLDILCGALGAFCFMMLVALPYYKPPGTEKSLREAQAETQRLLQDLENMKQRMKDPQAVAEMEDLIRRLEAQIKALQGQVNILSSEKEQLTGQVKQLAGEVSQLTAQASQLTGQVNQLTGRVSQLTNENEKLTEQDKELRKGIARLQERAPFLVVASTDGHQPLDLFLYVVDRVDRRPSPGTGEPRVPPQFDPAKQWNGTVWPGDVRLVAAKNGTTAWMMRDVPAGTQVKVYVKVQASDLAAGPALVNGSVQGSGRANIQLGDGSNVTTGFNAIKMPTVALTATRPWIFVGTISSPELGKVKFTAATLAEQEAEWKALSPGPTPPAP